MIKDELKKCFLCNDRVLLTVVKSTNLVNKAIELHQLTPTTAAVLGRALTMSVLMSAKLKNKDDNVTAIISGDGPVGKVITVGKFGSKVKGFVGNPSLDLMPNEKGKLDVGGAVGKGKLKIMMDTGLDKPYIGEVNLVSGEIAEDFASYYANSMQQPCVVALGVLVKENKCVSSAGVLIELMPDATEDDVVSIENVTTKLSDISRMLDGVSVENFIMTNFAELTPNIYETIQPKYMCDCSKTKVKKVIKSIKKDEREQLYDDNGEIEVVCDFCHKQIIITRDDIK